MPSAEVGVPKVSCVGWVPSAFMTIKLLIPATRHPHRPVPQELLAARRPGGREVGNGIVGQLGAAASVRVPSRRTTPRIVLRQGSGHAGGGSASIPAHRVDRSVRHREDRSGASSSGKVSRSRRGRSGAWTPAPGSEQAIEALPRRRSRRGAPAQRRPRPACPAGRSRAQRPFSPAPRSAFLGVAMPGLGRQEVF
jgi:hypothetical protein